MYYYGGGSCGCQGNNYPYPYYPVYPTYYGNNNNSAIIIVLFILLVIIIGSRLGGR